MPFSGCGGRSERTLPATETTERIEPCDIDRCALVWEGCCAPNPREGLERYRAVSHGHRESFLAETCPEPHPCIAPSEERRIGFPPVIAACTARGCELLDLTEDPVIACARDSDCHTRTKDCCECGGLQYPANLLAISDEERFSALACGERSSCTDCAATYSAPPTPRCVDGRCTLEW